VIERVKKMFYNYHAVNYLVWFNLSYLPLNPLQGTCARGVFCGFIFGDSRFNLFQSKSQIISKRNGSPQFGGLGVIEAL